MDDDGVSSEEDIDIETQIHEFIIDKELEAYGKENKGEYHDEFITYLKDNPNGLFDFQSNKYVILNIIVSLLSVNVLSSSDPECMIYIIYYIFIIIHVITHIMLSYIMYIHILYNIFTLLLLL